MNNPELNQPTLKPFQICENVPLPYDLSEFQLRFLLLVAKRIFTGKALKSSLRNNKHQKGKRL